MRPWALIFASFAWSACFRAAAQTPPPPPAPTADVAVPAQAPPAQPPKPSYRYEGKPIALRAECSDAELTDFALSCSEDDPCPVYLELASVDGSGSRISAAGNFHADTATLWSVLLMSEDGGKTWTEPFERVRGAALDLVQFPDFATGFVSGHGAGTLPKDPFFVRTSDGGKSWKRLPILEDGVIGIVERFHFDSATRGTVQLDRGRPGAGRYAVLETANGAENWVIRESSALRPPRPAKELPPLIRIVADAASKSFRVERREGGAWRTAAAFSVAAGVCRPGATSSKPAPPAEPPPSGQLH